MINLHHIKDLISKGSEEFRVWLEGNREHDEFENLSFDQSRLETVARNDSVEAIEQMLEITLTESTLRTLRDEEISPSLFKAIELLQDRRRKNKL